MLCYRERRVDGSPRRRSPDKLLSSASVVDTEFLLTEFTDVLHEGDAKGNGTAIRITLPSGLVVFGFATRNAYAGDWDYGPTWNYLERCGDILEILDDGPKSARQIAKRHFADHLLEGYGIIMAEHEILSHCELLTAAGDLTAHDGSGFQATGGTAFENLIESVVPS